MAQEITSCYVKEELFIKVYISVCMYIYRLKNKYYFGYSLIVSGQIAFLKI